MSETEGGVQPLKGGRHRCCGAVRLRDAVHQHGVGPQRAAHPPYAAHQSAVLPTNYDGTVRDGVTWKGDDGECLPCALGFPRSTAFSPLAPLPTRASSWGQLRAGEGRGPGEAERQQACRAAEGEIHRVQGREARPDQDAPGTAVGAVDRPTWEKAFDFRAWAAGHRSEDYQYDMASGDSRHLRPVQDPNSAAVRQPGCDPHSSGS